MSVDLGAAMLARLEVVGPTAYARDYADAFIRGRHDLITVEDTAAADGAAFKLADELADRSAWASIALDPWAAVVNPRIPGRHRA